MAHKCLVTLTIGEEFENQWNLYCQKNWQAYADKHGYDLINISEPLDVSQRAQSQPAWLKCLILNHPEIQKYDQAVWIDADILINYEDAPCICSFVPINQIGGVRDYSFSTPILYKRNLKKTYDNWAAKGIKYIDNLTPQLFYKNFGIETDIAEVMQTGVIVASPKYHKEIFEKVYYNYEDKGSPQWNYEMRPLSYEIIKSDRVVWLPQEFNIIVSTYLMTNYEFLMQINSSTSGGSMPYAKECLNTAFKNSYFLHFAGMGFSKMQLIDI